jgi:hypothetical protein
MMRTLEYTFVILYTVIAAALATRVFLARRRSFGDSPIFSNEALLVEVLGAVVIAVIFLPVFGSCPGPVLHRAVWSLAVAAVGLSAGRYLRGQSVLVRGLDE